MQGSKVIGARWFKRLLTALGIAIRDRDLAQNGAGTGWGRLPGQFRIDWLAAAGVTVTVEFGDRRIANHRHRQTGLYDPGTAAEPVFGDRGATGFTTVKRPG